MFNFFYYNSTNPATQTVNNTVNQIASNFSYGLYNWICIGGIAGFIVVLVILQLINNTIFHSQKAQLITFSLGILIIGGCVTGIILIKIYDMQLKVANLQIFTDNLNKLIGTKMDKTTGEFLTNTVNSINNIKTQLFDDQIYSAYLTKWDSITQKLSNLNTKNSVDTTTDANYILFTNIVKTMNNNAIFDVTDITNKYKDLQVLIDNVIVNSLFKYDNITDYLTKNDTFFFTYSEQYRTLLEALNRFCSTNASKCFIKSTIESLNTTEKLTTFWPTESIVFQQKQNGFTMFYKNISIIELQKDQSPLFNSNLKDSGILYEITVNNKKSKFFVGNLGITKEPHIMSIIERNNSFFIIISNGIESIFFNIQNNQISTIILIFKDRFNRYFQREYQYNGNTFFLINMLILTPNIPTVISSYVQCTITNNEISITDNTVFSIKVNTNNQSVICVYDGLNNILNYLFNKNYKISSTSMNSTNRNNITTTNNLNIADIFNLLGIFI